MINDNQLRNEPALVMATRKYQKILAKNCRKLRMEKGYSQDKLAILAGVSRPTVLRIETVNYYKTKANIESIIRIATALDVPVLILLKG